MFIYKVIHLSPDDDLTRSLREPGGPCTKYMEVSESRMERVKTEIIQWKGRYYPLFQGIHVYRMWLCVGEFWLCLQIKKMMMTKVKAQNGISTICMKGGKNVERFVTLPHSFDKLPSARTIFFSFVIPRVGQYGVNGVDRVDGQLGRDGSV